MINSMQTARSSNSSILMLPFAHQLAVFQCKNLYKGRQKRKREREGCIYLTDLPIPHVAQYTLSQLYIGHIRRCLLQRERLSHQTGRTLPVLQASCQPTACLKFQKESLKPERHRTEALLIYENHLIFTKAYLSTLLCLYYQQMNYGPLLIIRLLIIQGHTFCNAIMPYCHMMHSLLF